MSRNRPNDRHCRENQPTLREIERERGPELKELQEERDGYVTAPFGGRKMRVVWRLSDWRKSA